MKSSIVFLHGLFGSLSNWQDCVTYFENDFEVYVPRLPMYDNYEGNVLDYLVESLKKDMERLASNDITLVGNSLGGHVAILYAHRYPEKISKLVLTGSSGLYENYLSGSFPKRRDRNYVKKQVENVFYSPETATDTLIDEVLLTLADTGKCFKIVKAAKTTQRNYVTEILPQITQPVLLIWGADDKITPPSVAEQFAGLLPSALLIYFPQCGHAAMMEQSQPFNETMESFLKADDI